MNETSALMPQTKKKDKSSTGSSPAETSENSTKKRIDEHLKDINDTISDDDIRNINTDMKPDTNVNEEA